MLKKVSNAGFIILNEEKSWGFEYGAGTYREIAVPTSYAFKSGKLVGEAMSSDKHRDIMKRQKYIPVIVIERESIKWWMFQNEFYCADDTITDADIQTLFLAKQLKQKRTLERAKASISQDAYLQSDDRQPIPDDVKMFVWQRDGGRCVKCGSNKSLEFDHIIPFSQGGSNTARNLQILCESCNRSKGGNLC